MIKSFACKESQKIFNREFFKKLPSDIQVIAFRKLRMLNRSYTLDDLRIPPSNHLEKLKDDKDGFYSIRINDQWRICFKWEDGNEFEV